MYVASYVCTHVAIYVHILSSYVILVNVQLVSHTRILFQQLLHISYSGKYGGSYVDLAD